MPCTTPLSLLLPVKISEDVCCGLAILLTLDCRSYLTDKNQKLRELVHLATNREPGLQMVLKSRRTSRQDFIQRA